MSSTQRFGKAVESSSRKRVRTGTTITPTPTVPKGQTQHYEAKAVTSEGKKWYKSHTEAKRSGVLEERVDYTTPLFTTHLDVTMTKGRITCMDPPSLQQSAIREMI
ncbi:hypothetical protein H5410_005545 [Solanum commersonii]|uniref:Uncharacterized protein n=1 Tax=Solanum commersonii TaxID=4109 RepID=A0A9J6A8J6_SOLCO|nr:hypothetical protein H5410_005545 [Solanum commersonii]